MLPTLYVGLDAATAKVAPVHGLQAPVILTDVYAGNLGFYSLTKNGPIGVLQIDTNILIKNAFRPYPKDAKRKSWQSTLKSRGLCVYDADIPRHAIVRVGIYNPFDARYSNEFVNSIIADFNPRITLPNKSNYARSFAINRWLACEELREEHLPKESPRKILAFSDNCLNRSALELFYLRPEKEKWWRA